MPHRTTVYRRELKEKDPEKYEQLRTAGRERDNARNAHKRVLKERQELTAEEIERDNIKRLEKK